MNHDKPDSLIQPLEDRHRDYLKDESRSRGFAESISFPTSEAQVQAIVKTLAATQTPITVQGSRTGITGGAVPRRRTCSEPVENDQGHGPGPRRRRFFLEYGFSLESACRNWINSLNAVVSRARTGTKNPWVPSKPSARRIDSSGRRILLKDRPPSVAWPQTTAGASVHTITALPATILHVFVW